MCRLDLQVSTQKHAEGTALGVCRMLEQVWQVRQAPTLCIRLL